MPETQAVLEVRGLEAWYGESHVLHGVDLTVREGECITLLGRNGAGRSTTLKAILGLTDRRAGSVKVRGTEAIRLSTHRIARLGIGYCPEERGIYRTLTTQENLTLLPRLGPEGMAVAEVLAMFPNLAERADSYGGRLSGGEQQMLALGRILTTGARLLLLDEITEGLAPVIVEALGRAVSLLKSRGFTIVLVEQNFHFARHLADRHYVIEHGRVAAEIAAGEVAAREAEVGRLLGV
ncbi:ABC transporter ATP-binding protein [Methylobacterium aerolatum]|uniref:Branched-chain amino acid transport system ATP-binding protein n=1 Tax=Methylobacterium aerolatum TaxID=418708 RepID=A0ABU0HZP3_9HYPH|nr:ABC transporter ATP-binding protein [Methylobacterium aerolatum]MDQ0447812.1 branched-chain amino acid transport system ATP-binding protein [Methylobacterium aerolatum]GJD34910.1 High-affinity branched-chain amino acid transport ATP-binding protein LivF [Methylobacterium aerolatum]